MSINEIARNIVSWLAGIFGKIDQALNYPIPWGEIFIWAVAISALCALPFAIIDLWRRSIRSVNDFREKKRKKLTDGGTAT
jgi:hypothetical protein